MSTLAILARLPSACARQAVAHCQQTLRSARLQNEVHALAELCRCLDNADEGHIFHPPFLVIKGRVSGRSQLFAARLSPAEVERCRQGMPLPKAVARFVRSTRPLWRRTLGMLKPTGPVTVQELPGSTRTVGIETFFN
jgi:hypothetical protein